jgi:hypothetical protein
MLEVGPCMLSEIIISTLSKLHERMKFVQTTRTLEYMFLDSRAWPHSEIGSGCIMACMGRHVHGFGNFDMLRSCAIIHMHLNIAYPVQLAGRQYISLDELTNVPY